jgi:hypothetical protein
MNATLAGVVEDGTSPVTAEQNAQEVSIPQGESFVLTMTVTGENGTAFNLTGYTGVMAVRRSRTAATALFQRTGEILVAASGTMTFTGVPADTADATPSDYVFDVWLEHTATGAKYRVIPEEDADGDNSIFTVEDSVYDQDADQSQVQEPQSLIGVPAAPAYTARLVWDGSDLAWQQYQDVEVDFTDDSSAAVEWVDFEGRDFAVKVNCPVTSEGEAVQFVVTNKTDTGCTLTATGPITGTVVVTVEELMS